MNYFGIVIAVLQLCAGAYEFRYGQTNLAWMWTCVAGASFAVAWGR